jgi:transcriptional regulator with XRE-family HTH domain
MQSTVTARRVGRIVRESRLAAGLTQGELAMRARVSTRLVVSLEQGETPNIGLSKLVSVLDVLNLGVTIGPERNVDADGGGRVVGPPAAASVPTFPAPATVPDWLFAPRAESDDRVGEQR